MSIAPPKINPGALSTMSYASARWVIKKFGHNKYDNASLWVIFLADGLSFSRAFAALAFVACGLLATTLPWQALALIAGAAYLWTIVSNVADGIWARVLANSASGFNDRTSRFINPNGFLVNAVMDYVVIAGIFAGWLIGITKLYATSNLPIVMASCFVVSLRVALEIICGRFAVLLVSAYRTYGGYDATKMTLRPMMLRRQLLVIDFGLIAPLTFAGIAGAGSLGSYLISGAIEAMVIAVTMNVRLFFDYHESICNLKANPVEAKVPVDPIQFSVPV